VDGLRQKHLALILARELASQLVTPTFIADADGELVFYNEPAEDVLGRRFAEAGAMAAESWDALFQIEDLDGRRLPLERHPGGIALAEGRPAHERLRFTALDGRKRLVAVTAVPILASAGECVGVVIFFWEEREPEEHS
jgi:PAS domain-containing protein